MAGRAIELLDDDWRAEALATARAAIERGEDLIPCAFVEIDDGGERACVIIGYEIADQRSHMMALAQAGAMFGAHAIAIAIVNDVFAASANEIPTDGTSPRDMPGATEAIMILRQSADAPADLLMHAYTRTPIGIVFNENPEVMPDGEYNAPLLDVFWMAAAAATIEA